MKKVLILGAGRVGKAVASDLSGNEITIIDSDLDALKSVDPDGLWPAWTYYHMNPINRSTNSALYKEYLDIVRRQDLVINATPGSVGHRMLELTIPAGVNIVDVSFFGEDTDDLDRLSKDHNVAVFTDCGVAPGLCNVILGHYYSRHDGKIQSYECYVGGLPVVRKKPFEYQATFSIGDVLAEYTRPARFKMGGQLITQDALSQVEHMNFKNIGTLEAFLTDGLRSLLSLEIPDMIEKTMRWPGHADQMRFLKECGFFDEGFIDGPDLNPVKPIDLTKRILADKWKLRRRDRDFTIMRINIKGEDLNVVYDLYDEAQDGLSSMARTTGFTCSAIAQLVLRDEIAWKRGVCPPECIPECTVGGGALSYILSCLSLKGIKISHTALDV